VQIQENPQNDIQSREGQIRISGQKLFWQLLLFDLLQLFLLFVDKLLNLRSLKK